MDHVDRRIRRYVSAKRKLVALLEEEKQAVINQAVTRGLDPSVPLKPSGVEWLGDVPEHWENSAAEAVGFDENNRRASRNTGLSCRRNPFYVRRVNGGRTFRLYPASRLDIAWTTRDLLPQMPSST